MHSLGRIQMAFWIPDTLYQKYVAPPKNHIRCKMSVIVEACAKVDLICTTAPDDMYPSVSLLFDLYINNILTLFFSVRSLYIILYQLYHMKRV